MRTAKQIFEDRIWADRSRIKNYSEFDRLLSNIEREYPFLLVRHSGRKVPSFTDNLSSSRTFKIHETSYDESFNQLKSYLNHESNITDIIGIRITGATAFEIGIDGNVRGEGGSIGITGYSQVFKNYLNACLFEFDENIVNYNNRLYRVNKNIKYGTLNQSLSKQYIYEQYGI